MQDFADVMYGAPLKRLELGLVVRVVGLSQKLHLSCLVPPFDAGVFLYTRMSSHRVRAALVNDLSCLVANILMSSGRDCGEEQNASLFHLWNKIW